MINIKVARPVWSSSATSLCLATTKCQQNTKEKDIATWSTWKSPTLFLLVNLVKVVSLFHPTSGRRTLSIFRVLSASSLCPVFLLKRYTYKYEIKLWRLVPGHAMCYYNRIKLEHETEMDKKKTAENKARSKTKNSKKAKIAAANTYFLVPSWGWGLSCIQAVKISGDPTPLLADFFLGS